MYFVVFQVLYSHDLSVLCVREGSFLIPRSQLEIVAFSADATQYPAIPYRIRLNRPARALDFAHFPPTDPRNEK